jgi:hypothetical protein
MVMSQSWTDESRRGLQSIGRGRFGPVSDVGGSRKKEAPLVAGLMVACLFVEECFRSSCSYPMRSLSSRLPKKEQALCQTNPTSNFPPNPPGGAPGDAKFDFGQYVTSARTGLLSKSSTPLWGGAAT